MKTNQEKIEEIINNLKPETRKFIENYSLVFADERTQNYLSIKMSMSKVESKRK